MTMFCWVVCPLSATMAEMRLPGKEKEREPAVESLSTRQENLLGDHWPLLWHPMERQPELKPVTFLGLSYHLAMVQSFTSLPISPTEAHSRKLGQKKEKNALPFLKYVPLMNSVRDLQEYLQFVHSESTVLSSSTFDCEHTSVHCMMWVFIHGHTERTGHNQLRLTDEIKSIDVKCHFTFSPRRRVGGGHLIWPGQVQGSLSNPTWLY